LALAGSIPRTFLESLGPEAEPGLFSFSTGDRRLIEIAAAAEYANSLAEGNANNALSLRKLREEGTVKILHFPEALLREFNRVSKDIVAEAGAEDDLTRKIHASYVRFRAMSSIGVRRRTRVPERPQACRRIGNPVVHGTVSIEGRRRRLGVYHSFAVGHCLHSSIW
jgi:hypothetical protein